MGDEDLFTVIREHFLEFRANPGDPSSVNPMFEELLAYFDDAYYNDAAFSPIDLIAKTVMDHVKKNEVDFF